MAEDKKTNVKSTKKAEDKPTAKKPPKAEASPSKKAKSPKQASAAPQKKEATKAKTTDKPAAKPAKKKGGPTKRAPLIEGTYFAKVGEVKPKWRIVDASNQTLGRLSTYIARALMGKDKPEFTRHADTGDYVVVVNAEKVRLTGKKISDKWYHRYSGFSGGIKSTNPKELFEKHPENVLKWAVWGMLPKNHMGRQWYKKLKVYAGEDHPHQAQKPELVKFEGGKTQKTIGA